MIIADDIQVSDQGLKLEPKEMEELSQEEEDNTYKPVPLNTLETESLKV